MAQDPSSLTGSPDLVGRTAELDTLRRAAEAARAGKAGLVTLQGPPGIGKTSLLRSFTRGDACRGMTVLHGVCREIDAGAGYGGVRALFGPLELCADEADASALLSGEAGRALPALTRSPLDEEPSAAYAVMHGLYWLAVNLMAQRPLVLVLDDVQWCDESSLRWIDFLLRRSDGLPLLAVLAQRSETEPLAPGVLTDIASRRWSSMIPLAPLTRQEVTELVHRTHPGPVSPSFARSVADLPGGNPMLISRLLLRLKSAGVPPDDEGALRVAEVAGGVVTDSVRDLLDGVPPWVRELARAVAVLGETPAARAGALAGLPPALVQEGLQTLRNAEVLAPDRVEMVHDLVRTAVLDEAGPDELALLRTQAAQLLSDEGLPSEEVASHLLLLPEVTLPWMSEVLSDAAVRAEGRAAPEAAARYLRKALTAEPDSLPLRLQLAKCVSESDPEEALRLLKEILALPLDVRTRAGVALQFGAVCLANQQAPAAVDVLDGVAGELGAELGPEPAPADRELLTAVQAVLLLAGADEKVTVRAARERAAAMTPPPGDTPAQRQLLSMKTVLKAMEGGPPEQTTEWARRALLSPDASRESWSLLASSFTLSLADEVQESLDALRRMLRESQQKAAVWSYALALSSRAFVLHGMGAYTDALTDAQTSVDIIGQERWGHTSTMPQTALATVLVERGEPARAQELLESITRPRMDRFVMEYHWYLMARARTRWALGDAEGALAQFLECGRSLDEAGVNNPVFLPWWVEAVAVLDDLERTHEAHAVVEHADSLARRWPTLRGRALAALARGMITPGEDGIEHFSRSVELFAASPARAEHARAEFLLGRALMRRGSPRAARDHLRTAADLAQRCGALVLADTARKLLVTAGGRMRRMSAAPLDLLTGTERKVADLAAAGTSNRSIAESLFVTVRTVETHLTSVYRKLGVRRRSELEPLLRSLEASEGELPGRPPYTRVQS